MAKLRIVIAIIAGFFCSILLSGLIASYIVPHLHMPIIIQAPVIFLAGLPGPFFTGIISKKHGWIAGSTVIILYEILLAIAMILMVRGNSTPSSSTRVTDYYIAESAVQLLLCGGLTVFFGSLSGHFGEQVGRKMLSRKTEREK